MNDKRASFRPSWFSIALIALLVYMIFRSFAGGTAEKITNTQLETLIDSGTELSDVRLSVDGGSGAGTVTIMGSDGRTVSADVTDIDRIARRLEEKDIDFRTSIGSSSDLIIATVIPSVIALVVMVMLIRMMSSAAGGQGARMNEFSKSRARLSGNVNITLSDVAGMVEEKDEVKEIIEFLKNPRAFNEMGARIPKGVILVGSPGTGKTLLAKAVAGEAKVPFYSISGSDFVEMFVGVGAARVRDMFAEAKKNAPCIVFIDEIDAVARRRGTGLGGSHDEREQTLNQMLVEMDGFETNQGIIVMAATNRVDILDPAIMRPGRFDRKITIGHPDMPAREAILRVHARNKHLAGDVDLHRIAQTTAGYTGADLENLLNEAAIEATMQKKSSISQKDINDAFIKTGIGKEKRSKVISERDKRITAYHETGHAILFHLLKDVGPVHIISIIPTGDGAAGYTMPLPDKDDSHITKGQLKHMMMAAMGGRIAEELVCDDITTGASQDIKQVTKIARAMVMQYGMSDRIGMINCDDNSGDDVFLGYDIARNKTYGEDMLTLIDKEIKQLVDECYNAAKEIILEHRDVLEKSCSLLMEKEKITGEEFAALFNRDQTEETGSGSVKEV